MKSIFPWSNILALFARSALILHILLSATLFILASAAHSQTKPSDVFFYPPAEAGHNNKPAASIISRNVTLRGCLTSGVIDNPGTNAVAHNTSPYPIGYEDVWYYLVLDYDFIEATYGGNSTVLSGAQLHGNPVDGKTTPFSFQNVGADGKPTNVDINSFWLPNDERHLKGHVASPLTIHVELNAWHQRSSNFRHCNILWLFDCVKTVEGRGPAPRGCWCEKEYTAGPLIANTVWCDTSNTSGPPTTSADNWWPFDPDNPEGLTEVNHKSKYLKIGDYVEIRGTLWQDSGHGISNCWGETVHNQDGWPEIHPVDSIHLTTYLSGNSVTSSLSPIDDALNSAAHGIKRVYAVSVCSDSQGKEDHRLITLCPEGEYEGFVTPSGRTIQPLVPHVQELVDRRFSVAGPTVNHGASVVGDCVKVSAYILQGVKWAHFKARYLVWWTPAI